MKTPGFIIKNETIWPLQISLNQVGPLYFDVIKPGESFVRDTGAVWFTIKASIIFDDKDKITTWDAVWPIGAITASVLLTVVTAGSAAYAAGPAIAAAGGATGAIAGATTGLSAGALIATSAAAQALVGAGFSAGASLVVAGAVVGGTTTALTATVSAALKDIFKKENSAVSEAGCYAGAPWPFRGTVTPYRVTGGPTYRQSAQIVDGKPAVELVPATLNLVR